MTQITIEASREDVERLRELSEMEVDFGHGRSSMVAHFAPWVDRLASRIEAALEGEGE